MKMSTNSATTTMSTDNGISLVEANERAGEGDGGDDQLTINSLSSSLSSSTAATDTEGESGVDGAEGGRKAKKRRADGSFSRGSSGKEIEELDGEETAPEEDAALEAEAPPYAEKTRDRAIGRLITFSCILFTVPLTLMYITYRFLFIGHYQLAHDRAILYAGIFAAATVYLILAVFAWIAYRSRDETEFAQQVTIAEGGDGDKKTD